jgi:hypothetical protein
VLSHSTQLQKRKPRVKSGAEVEGQLLGATLSNVVIAPEGPTTSCPSSNGWPSRCHRPIAGASSKELPSCCRGRRR